jgi:CubicO group peptidase (beta-lactamase class C family)
VLGALVERLSGESLDEYAAKHIFAPLGMKETRFLPPHSSWEPRIAPTEEDENHHLLRGVVHDPTARRMGGVAGHAGVFSTADDLAIFAQACSMAGAAC